MCPKKITNLKALYPPMKPKYYMIHFTIITIKLLFLLSTNVISLSILKELRMEICFVAVYFLRLKSVNLETIIL